MTIIKKSANKFADFFNRKEESFFTGEKTEREGDKSGIALTCLPYHFD